MSSEQKYEEEKCRLTRTVELRERKNVSTNTPQFFFNKHVHHVASYFLFRCREHINEITCDHNDAASPNDDAGQPPDRPTYTRKQKVHLSIYEREYIDSFCHSLPCSRIFLILYQVLPPFHFAMCMCN